MLQPLRRRMWAPRGQTPVQHPWGRHDRITALAALVRSPWAERFNLYCQFLDHNARTDDIVDFVRDVHRHLRRPIVLICDRLPAHRSAVRRLQRESSTWFSAEWLPPYAPELDPVEYFWSQTKYGDLANFIPEDISELRRSVMYLVEEYRHDPQLLRAFFQGAQLVY